MKKVIISFVIMVFAFTSTFAIGEKYDSNTYEAVPVTINTKGYEFGLSNYRNNSLVFFRTNPENTEAKKKMPIKDIMVYQTKLTSSGELAEPTLCEELMDLGVSGSFAYDQRKDKIYFSKYNDLKKVYQLYESKYIDGEWERAELVEIKNLTPSRMNMSPIVNANWDYLDPGASIIHPSLAKNGNRIYFTSNLKGGEGKTDIWYIDYEGNDAWSEPVNVGANVNTAMNEQYPYVVGDSLLYYATNNEGEGAYDIYVARLAKNENDTIEVENLGALVNTAANQYNFIKSGDKFLYISERDSTLDDIMALSVLPTPDEIFFAESLPEAVLETYTEPEFHHVLFFFDFDKFNMKKEYEDQLQQAVLEMKQFGDRKFEVVGHTDERGSDAYNNRLSKKRAKTIVDLLVERGIDKNSIVLKSYGKSMPTVKDASAEEDHAKNRRVEINFYSEK